MALGESSLEAVGATFWADAVMVMHPPTEQDLRGDCTARQAQDPTKAYPGLHNGVMGWMPASYTVDYAAMIAVAVTFAIFEEETCHCVTAATACTAVTAIAVMPHDP